MKLVVQVLLILVLGLHLLRIESAKLDEDLVYDYYQKNINATRLFDAETLCEMMDPEYRMVDVGKTPRGEQRVVMGRKQACDATRESMGMMRKAVAKLRVEPEFKYTIESVTLSPDRRRATVKVRASMRIGKAISVTSAGTWTGEEPVMAATPATMRSSERRRSSTITRSSRPASHSATIVCDPM